jgi:phosphatidate cytidylyltransferase
MASTLIGLVLLRAKPNGPGLAFYALSLAFVNDSSAYFLGRWIGKKKLAPRVSPKKTWEGCICGILIGTIWSILITIIFWSNSLSILSMIIVTVPTLIAAVIGDLFISVLKRESNLKDTGKLLPGHGGLLDRIDAILMAIPIFALVALQVGIL